MLAIDVTLEPDTAMISHARAVNAQLRQDYPTGYELDAAHAPRITLVQRFIRRRDIERVIQAVKRAVRSGPQLPLTLEATGYASTEWGGMTVVVYVVDRTRELLQLASATVSAVQPFSVRAGARSAFAKSGREQITDDMVAYVEHYVPQSSGLRYKPHVVLGLCNKPFVKTLTASPFERFTFKGVNVTICHLAYLGTTRRRLWDGSPVSLI